MAREQRDPRGNPDRPGQRPLLQGHLAKGARRPGEDEGAAGDGPPEQVAPEQAAPDSSVQPASEVAKAPADAVRGKATRSPAEVATRPHLEGSEQGPS